MAYEFALKKIVCENSVSDEFNTARHEWNLSDYHYDDGICECGKRGLKHLYEITNQFTHKTLYPIGSECIKYFENEEMERKMKIARLSETIFKNEGKKHDGKTYMFIYENDKRYISFLRDNSIKKKYEKLIWFADLMDEFKYDDNLF